MTVDAILLGNVIGIHKRGTDSVLINWKVNA